MHAENQSMKPYNSSNGAMPVRACEAVTVVVVMGPPSAFAASYPPAMVAQSSGLGSSRSTRNKWSSCGMSCISYRGGAGLQRPAAMKDAQRALSSSASKPSIHADRSSSSLLPRSCAAAGEQWSFVKRCHGVLRPRSSAGGPGRMVVVGSWHRNTLTSRTRHAMSGHMNTNRGRERRVDLEREPQGIAAEAGVAGGQVCRVQPRRGAARLARDREHAAALRFARWLSSSSVRLRCRRSSVVDSIISIGDVASAGEESCETQPEQEQMQHSTGTSSKHNLHSATTIKPAASSAISSGTERPNSIQNTTQQLPHSHNHGYQFTHFDLVPERKHSTN
ncbi:hypothetical protein U9M48_011367 [Paspalum notatum var. saurae]|uniref:Uncharacterized protein n=1 Tax=Paspalum notatum var. saurae TaxID=547442 RepID=A0AAQ3WH30_PASNO